jgi:hypothetical protein
MVPKRTIAFPFPPSRQTTILAPKRSVSLPSSPCLRPEEVCLIAEFPVSAPRRGLSHCRTRRPTKSTHEEVCPIADSPPPKHSRRLAAPRALTKRSVQLPTHEEVCPIADSPPPATTPSHPRSPPSHHPVPLQRGLSHCRVVQPVPLQAAFHRRGLSNCHLCPIATSQPRPPTLVLHPSHHPILAP